MSHTYEKVSSNKAKITFEIPAEKFDEATQQAYLKNRGRLNVPGFRRGKAPRSLVERMYGESVFYDDAFDLLFPEAYRAAVEEFDLRPVDQPSLSKMDQIGKGQDLKFEIEVFVYPDVTLGEYKNLEVEIVPQKLTDEMVDNRVEQDRQKAARAVEVEDRPVQNGDTVNLDYAGTVDGVPFEGGAAEGQELKIGSNRFIPGFEEQMVGMKLGEEKDLNVRFPDDYHSEEVKGKDAVFHVKVNSIMTTELPELDDDFAMDISEFDTFDEYKADIVRQMTEQVEKNNRAMVENAAVEKAVANAQMDIPDAMIDDEVDRLMDNMRYEMAMQGIDLKDYLKYFRMTEEDLKAQRRPEAENRVKSQLVIEAIRKAENLEPTDEDVEEATREQAENYGEDLEDFREHLNDAQKEYLKENAAIRKVLKLLRESAKVTEKAPEEKAEAEAEEKPEDEAGEKADKE